MAGIGDNALIEILEGPSVSLAPLSGYTDAPFRLLCSEFGADFTVTEMVSSEGLVRGGRRTCRLVERLEGEAPVGIQLFGSNPDVMARAAVIAEEVAPAFIDLNFGCPVKKVVRRNGGAAVMRDLRLMERIAREVVRSVRLPVTAKIRSGWNINECNYLEAGKVLEQSGISAVTLHPRYKSQGFGGKADWEMISRLEGLLSIPVIANGDIRLAEDYSRMAAFTGVRNAMVGRGALGRPWVFKEIKDCIAGREPKRTGLAERLKILERHVGMEVEWKGEAIAILEMRKHYRWYFKGLPGIKDFRHRMSQACTKDEVFEVLGDLREESDKKWKKPA